MGAEDIRFEDKKEFFIGFCTRRSIRDNWQYSIIDFADYLYNYVMNRDDEIRYDYNPRLHIEDNLRVFGSFLFDQPDERKETLLFDYRALEQIRKDYEKFCDNNGIDVHNLDDYLYNRMIDAGVARQFDPKGKHRGQELFLIYQNDQRVEDIIEGFRAQFHHALGR